MLVIKSHALPLVVLNIQILVLAVAVVVRFRNPPPSPAPPKDLVQGDSCLLYEGYFINVICAVAVFLTCS